MHMDCTVLKEVVNVDLAQNLESLVIKTFYYLAHWKVLFDGMDVRLLIKSYLDKLNISDCKFKDNYPRNDWLSDFVKRHNLTQ